VAIILTFAWKYLLFFLIWNSLVVFLFHELEHIGIDLSIPFLPLSTIGIAVSFYVGFKNGQSYDRFWEARKIWGGIVNYSRTWSNQVLNFVTDRHATQAVSKQDLQAVHQQLIYRHIAWLNALRISLRRPSSFSLRKLKSIERMTEKKDYQSHLSEEVKPLIDEKEYNYLVQRKNVPTQLIRKQGDALRELMESKGYIEDFRHMEMMRVLEEFYNLQGKCERINNTPFPRQYAYFSKIFTWIFIILLPFGMVGEFAQMGHELLWLTVPFCMLISWIFLTMELIGDNSEDPFENNINDVPMTALCRTIEIDLREMLGETDLPPKTEPVYDVLF